MAVRSFCCVQEQQHKVHSLTNSMFGWHNKPTADDTDIDVIELQPGDVLYHPAGIWHRVECTADSISANISLVGTDWATMVADGIKQML